MKLQEVEPPIRDAALADRVFDGQVLVFRRVGPIRELCRAARRSIREELGTRDPVKAHEIHSRAELVARVRRLQTRFRRDPEIGLSFREALAELGLDLEALFWDRMVLRVVPPRTAGAPDEIAQIGPHRDVWGVGIQQQVNWWAPIFPVARNRTLCIYPDHWSRPLANTSASWRLATYIAESRGRRHGRAGGYPSTPEPLETPRGSRFEPVIRPGDLLCFSSAHLHASVPNRSAFTRVSFEIRTFSRHDVRLGRGAPNVDCASPRPEYRLFRNVLSGEKAFFGDRS